VTDLFEAMMDVADELDRRTDGIEAVEERKYAEAVKAQAIAQADANADPDWKVEAERVVRRLAEQGQPFTADDVWGLLQGVSTHEPAALGGVVQRLAREKVISRTGRQVPSRLERRHRDLTEWVGTEHLGAIQRQAMWQRYDDDLAALAKLTKQMVLVNIHPGGPCVVHWGTVKRTEARTLAAAAAKALREAKG
jgi:hypothetical protein